MPRLQARDSGIWWGTLGKLQLMLRKASQALFANEQFTVDEMHNYRMAVTEREVINGCLSVDNVKDHVIIYTRILQNINLQNLKRASAFIDIQDRYASNIFQSIYNLPLNLDMWMRKRSNYLLTTGTTGQGRKCSTKRAFTKDMKLSGLEERVFPLTHMRNI